MFFQKKLLRNQGKFVFEKYLTVLEKIYYKSFIRFNGIGKCFYKYKTINASTPVVLYLDYPKFIHLGDNLWCEPVARLLAESFDLAICCDSAMEFYFQRLGYKVIDKSSINQSDVLIARTELAYHLRDKDVFWINFNYINVSEPLINAVLNNIADYLGLNMSEAKPRALMFSAEEKNDLALKLGINPQYKYSVFNNYIDSHSWKMGKREFRKANNSLRQFAEKYKQEAGITLIHTGTKKDRDRDPAYYQTGDLDLRGITSVRESFILASLDNVINYIGFDAFWLHLFNIYDKSSYVMLRSGFSNEWKNQVKKYVLTPYVTAEEKVGVID